VAGSKVDERAWTINLVVMLCLVATGVYWLTPPIPEFRFRTFLRDRSRIR
jgi:hypothetical protein